MHLDGKRSIGCQWDPSDFFENDIPEASLPPLSAVIGHIPDDSTREKDRRSSLSRVESSGTSPVRESGDKATRTFTSNEMEILSANEYSSDEDACAVRDKTDIYFSTADDLDTSLSDIEQLEDPSVDKEGKYLVFRSCLKSLLQLARCPECDKVILSRKEILVGSHLTVHSTCIQGHSSTWSSQPMINGMAAGNLLLPPLFCSVDPPTPSFPKLLAY